MKQTAERISTAIGNAIMTAFFFALAPSSGFHNAVIFAFVEIMAAQLIAFGIGHYDMRRAQKAKA